MQDSIYIFRLISIECIQAQTPTGDTVRITRDDATIWESSPYTMHQTPSHEQQISAFDFAGGRKELSAQDWQADENFNVNSLIFTAQTGESHLELLLDGASESLADAVISAKDAGRGNIMIVCSRENVLYHLVYRVDAEA